VVLKRARRAPNAANTFEDGSAVRDASTPGLWACD